MEETTWTNTCTSVDPPLTLEDLMSVVADLKERMKSVVSRLEVGNEEMRQWLIAALTKTDPITTHLMALGGLEIVIDKELTENAILAKNRDGKALHLIIRTENDRLLMIDLKLSDKWMDFTKTK